MFSPSSKARLTARDLGRFPGDGLFDRIGRAACGAGCLPRKELFEAWEVARRVRRIFRGGRILDLGGGHGMLAHILLVLDDSSPDARVVDAAIPPSSGKLHGALAAAWPRLAGRIAFVERRMEHVAIEEGDLVVASHACGHLTDVVLERAAAARARVAVLPCCHHLARGETGGLAGWLDGPAAMDVARATRLTAHGYRIWTQTIPATITPKNRLLIGEPTAQPGLKTRPTPGT
jgi:hypothetical protein